MPRKNNDVGRAANGSGSIRKRTTTRNGRPYTYWEARCTTGYDTLTGKQIQRTVTGKTRKDVAQRLRELTSEVDSGLYIQPSQTTLSDWLNIWQQDYLTAIKPSTAFLYRRKIELYIVPYFGNTRLVDLNTTMIQHFYNQLLHPTKPDVRPLCAKTVKDIHGVLHQALDQAVANGELRVNPSVSCKLPKLTKAEIKPLEEEQITAFMQAIQGHPHEYLYLIAMFTGMREAEILGLTWDCVDLDRGFIVVKQQIRKAQEKGGDYYISTPKNGRKRIVSIGPSVVNLFRLQREKLASMKENAGELWSDLVMLDTLGSASKKPYDLVFRNEIGDRLSYRTVYDCFKRVVAGIGLPNVRFHDLRHTYAVASIKSGDDIKTVQSNLGHATAAFTLDVYGHITEQMRRDSADRMEKFIQSVSAQREK